MHSPVAAVLVAILVASLAGCAAPRQQGPPLTPSAAIAPAFRMPTVRERMVYLALQEWALFGSPVLQPGDGDGEDPARPVFSDPAAAGHELQAPMLTRVLTYWYAVSRLPIVGSAGELRPWSAAFVSWLARAAGLGADDFPPTVLHWDYIERFLAGRADDRFMTRDPAHYAPRVGDLVCNARGAAAAAPPDLFARLRRGPYHCDLVVAARDGAIEAIGGNVGDAVALVRLPVDAHGLLRPHPRRRWAAVLENRDR